MRKSLFITILGAVLITSCNSTAKLTKRYNKISITEDNDFIAKNIKVSAYVIEKEKTEPAKPKTIFDLSPKAQAALIAEVAKKETTTEKFLGAVANPVASKQNSSAEILDYSQFEKRIVVSVRNKSHMPADRICKMEVKLEIQNDLKLLSCNKLTTEFQTVDLGKVNYSSTQNAELSGGVATETGAEVTTGAEGNGAKGTSKVSGNLSGKVSTSRTLAEEVMLKQRSVALNAAINDNALTLYQDGTSGIDLTGNILADVIVGFDDLKVEKIYAFSGFTKDDVLVDAKDLKVNEKIIIYPNLTKDITVQVSFEADFRSVTKKHNTISESDDEASIIYGTSKNSKAEIFIPKNKIQPKLWKLTFSNDPAKMPIVIKGPTAVGSGDLLFNSIGEARDFVLWLKTKYDDTKKSITIGTGYTISMPAGFTNIANIEILPYN